MTAAARAPRWYVLALALVTLVCAARVPAIWYSYPFEGYVDEPYLVDYAYAIARSGDLNPQRFYYPSLTYYLLAGIYRLFTPLAAETPGPDHFVLARGLVLCFASAAVPLTAELARRLTSPLAGLAAGVFLALSPLLTSFSFLATVNPPMAFWSVLAGLSAVRILQGDRRARVYALAAAFSGLAVGTKYVTCAVPLLAPVAHFLGAGERRLKPLLVYALAVPLVFLLTTPYALLDHAAFLADMELLGGMHEREDLWLFHQGAAGTSYAEIASGLSRRALHVAPLVLAGLGLAWGLIARRRAALLLALVPLLTYLWLGSFKVYFVRNFIGALPFLAALAGLGVHALSLGLRRLPRRWSAALLTAALAGAAWLPARASWAEVRTALLEDTRTAALHWIRANVPAGARIVREYKTPPLEELGDDYEVLYVRSIMLPDRRAECETYDYVIVSWPYRRVVTQVDGRAQFVAAYEEFFERHELAAEFLDDGRRYTGGSLGIVRIRR